MFNQKFTRARNGITFFVLSMAVLMGVVLFGNHSVAYARTTYFVPARVYYNPMYYNSAYNGDGDGDADDGYVNNSYVPYYGPAYYSNYVGQGYYYKSGGACTMAYGKWLSLVGRAHLSVQQYNRVVNQGAVCGYGNP